jgi:hypothetical protein
VVARVVAALILMSADRVGTDLRSVAAPDSGRPRRVAPTKRRRWLVVDASVWRYAEESMRTRLALAVVLAGLVLALVPGAALADVIPPGAKSVQYCFEVTNVADFPDYVLVAAMIPNGHQVLKAGDCTGLNRGATVYAMKRSDYDSTTIPQGNQAEQAFFTTSPKVIRPGRQISPLRTVDQRDRLTAIIDVLTIAALNDETLDLRFASVRYTFDDGTKQELPYQQQAVRPEPNAAPLASSSGTAPSAGGGTTLPASTAPRASTSTSQPTASPATVSSGGTAARGFSLAWFAFLPLAALIAIGVIILLRRRRA